MLKGFNVGSVRWRNNVFLLSLYNGVEGVFSGLLWSIYAVYLVELGFSGVEFGFVSMLNAVVGGFLSLVSGLIVDKFGAKFLLILGHIMRSLGIVFLWLGSFATISAYSIISGLSAALFLAAHNVILSLSVPREKMHYAFTRVEALMLLGMFFGGLAGWIPKIVSDAYGLPLVKSYKLTLLSCSIGSFILVTLLLMIKEPPRETDKVQVGEPSREELKEFRRTILSLGIAAILVGLGAGISIHIIGFYFAKKYGITSGEYGSLFAAENLAMGLLMLITPNIADRVGGPLKTYLALISLSIPFLLAITFVNSFMVAAVLYFIRTTLMNAANPLYTAVAMRLVKPSLRGRTMGIIIASRNIFAGIGRFFGGALLDVNLELPLRITVVMYISYILFIKSMIDPLVKAKNSYA